MYTHGILHSCIMNGLEVMKKYSFYFSDIFWIEIYWKQKALDISNRDDENMLWTVENDHTAL